jgi:hypothetical protein
MLETLHTAFSTALVVWPTSIQTTVSRAFSVTLSLDCPDLPYGDAYATYVTVCVASTGQHSSRMIVTCEPRFHVTDASRWKGM